MNDRNVTSKKGAKETSDRDGHVPNSDDMRHWRNEIQNDDMMHGSYNKMQNDRMHGSIVI